MLSHAGFFGHGMRTNGGTPPMTREKQDIDFLRHTILLADQAVSEGNHPFGAVLVSSENEILAEGKNSFKVDKGPGHAETNLARDAARRFDEKTLLGSTLYTSVEPCSMCSGTIYWANIGAVVFGMTEKRLGELTGDDPENPTQDLECRIIFASGQRPVDVRGPYPELEDEIAAQHIAFWNTA
jgi:tRNA(Arg) A34 adenosine deaminase TadA